MDPLSSSALLSTILRHDNKQTSYKIALLRAINDIVLSFPDLTALNRDVAVPLSALAAWWVAYYWPFVAPMEPIWQGPRARQGTGFRDDMAFREALTAFRIAWESVAGLARPADGFLIIQELRLPRKRATYPRAVIDAYDQAIRAICQTLEMPIRYAGPGQWTVFARPRRLAQLGSAVIGLPGAQAADRCVVIRSEIWRTFHQLSLWVEALSLHEWCLFTAGVRQDPSPPVERGAIYQLLTERPDNRRPLTWERNQIDVLILEGHTFVCPWTERALTTLGTYDVDHLVPLTVYPINELWNLVPVDSYFNQHVKRDRLPSTERLARALPHLAHSYELYERQPLLAIALAEDVALRFASVPHNGGPHSLPLAQAVIGFIDQVAIARNLARFG
jgi:hypothetical protein